MENNNALSAETATNSKKSFFASPKNKMFIAIGVVVILFAALWIWKAAQISQLKKENERKEIRIKQQASDNLSAADYRYLKLLTKPFAWAIRSEMMKGNLEAVNLYANELVKEKNFKVITIVNDKGVVISSTDKKLESKPFSAFGNTSYLSADSTAIYKTDSTTLGVYSPVMGLNKRIGTLVFTYSPARAEWK